MLSTPEEKKTSMTAPSASENAELFSLFRKVFPGSELDVRMLYQIRYGYTPKQDLKSTGFTGYTGTFVDRPMSNTLNLMAGRPLPYPDQWGPQSQFLYDWFVDFLKSDNWNEKSQYERAYGAYRYLAKKYKYGAFYEETPLQTDEAEGASYMAKRLNGEQFVCEQFAQAYYLLGTAVGLDVGFVQMSEPWHVYNVVNIDGTIYIADASGYSKYNVDSYFGVYKDHFYYDLNHSELMFQNASLTLTPVEEAYADYPAATVTNPQGQKETLWKATRAARQYP